MSVAFATQFPPIGVILTVVIRRPARWRELELEPGGVVTAPMHMIDVIAGLVERGDARHGCVTPDC